MPPQRTKQPKHQNHCRSRSARLRQWQKINGRQRHLLCATQGLALELVVTPANIAESQGARLVCHKIGRRRWVIERTFCWLSAHRRLARDYEGCLAHSESLVWIALSHILLK